MVSKKTASTKSATKSKVKAAKKAPVEKTSAKKAPV